MMSSRSNHVPRAGVTLLELLIALALVSVVVGIAAPRVRRLVDAIGARGAAGDAAALFGSARQLAITRWVRTTVTVDTMAGVVSLVAGPDTLIRRDVHHEHGATLHVSRTSATYTPLGLALGVSNLTVIAVRGAAAETVTVSRLGRVRW